MRGDKKKKMFPQDSSHQGTCNFVKVKLLHVKQLNKNKCKAVPRNSSHSTGEITYE